MAEDTRRNRRHRNALEPGYRLHWYEIDSILGQGGFGITYLARDTNLDQLVAIKEFLPQELAVREGDSSVHPVTDGHTDTFGWGLSRFLTEARTLAKFRHPNIVTVHSVFEANNTAYMVMSYEHGRSLEDALKFRKVQGEEQLLAILYPLLEGLEMMHEAGFIHRDIKPQNIFIREDGTPVLLDFGSARLALGGQTRTLTTLVSPGYAPFEQYETSREGGRQGPWTDIYSLGATMYMAVTGHGPPDAVTRANARLEGRPDPLIPARAAAPPGFSPGFLYAIDSALAFQAAERPKNVAQWRHMLESGEAPEDGSDVTVVRGQPHPPAAPLPDTTPLPGGPDTREATRSPPPSADTEATRLRERPPPGPRQARWEAPAKRGRAGLVALLLVAVAVLAAGGWVATRYLGDGSLPFVADSGPPPDATPSGSQATAGAPDPTPGTDPGTGTGTGVARQAQDAEAAREAREEAAMASLQSGTESGASQQRREQPPGQGAEQPADLAAAAGEAMRERGAEQSRIDALLDEAEADLAAGRLLEPSDDSALYRYRYVLGLDPGNARAQDGLRRITDILVDRGVTALGSGKLDAAEGHLLRAEMIAPEAESVLRLRERLSDAQATVAALREAERARAEQEARRAAEAEARRQAEEEARRQAEAEAARQRADAEARQRAEAEAQARAEAEARRRAEEQARRAAAERAAAEQQARGSEGARIDDLLAAAAVDIEATRLTSPAGRNALEKYDAVLQMDPGNRGALAGKQRIVERYLDLADAAARNGRVEQAGSYLDRAETVLPGSELVGAARARLDAAARAARSPAPSPAPAPAPAPSQPARVATAPAPQPAAPPQPPKPALRLPAHVAIMPVETKRTCFEPDDRRVRDAAVNAITDSAALTIAFDAYLDSSFNNLQDQVWTGSRTQRQPAVEQVRSVARGFDADVVFLAFIDCSHIMGANKGRFPYTFWTIDLDTGETIVREGRLSNIGTGARELFQAVISAREAAARS